MSDSVAAVPRVSVCIPTYKGARTIGAAIESVLAQTLTDFELLVLDDGSPDDTASVVAGFPDRRLRYVRNPQNLGPEGNWNRCLDLAKGRYFKLLPHDDLLAPRCLERQVAVLEQDRAQELSLVFCARQVIGPTGRLLMQRGYPGAREGRLGAAMVRRQSALRGTNLLGEPGALLFRLALARSVGHFDARDPYVIDMDYWLRLLGHGDAYYCNEPLAAFRVSAEQWSVVLGQQQSDDFRRCINRHLAHGDVTLGPVDRLLAQAAPIINNLARRVFYRLYLR